ncbi:MAG: aldo/keto reductase [Sporomusaceae bacterium]|jgi:predicted aldo/keto reductase-like oxidoreductase|nr:aldo/keto reductase [Sporomusaceae bacterium]
MRYIRLGKTGLMVSELGFGGIPILRLGAEDAVKIVRTAFAGGINFFDTANAYQDSESKIGKAFAGMRDKVIIATKTTRRDGKGAAEQLENSLKMLQTDYLDLYQLHQVSQEADWEEASAPGGVLEMVKKAQTAGKIRHLGVTSHSLAMAVKLIQTGHFSTIQFPFNFIEEDANKELFPLAQKMDLGIIAMKPFAGGMLDNAALAFKYLRQFPNVVPIPGIYAQREIEEILAIYQQPNLVTNEDLAAMDKYRQELGKTFCRRCEYCQPCPNGVFITPIMIYPAVLPRMGDKTAAAMFGQALATAPNCTECGECLPRCPYELPIPEMVAKHYETYQNYLKKTL